MCNLKLLTNYKHSSSITTSVFPAVRSSTGRSIRHHLHIYSCGDEDNDEIIGTGWDGEIYRNGVEMGKNHWDGVGIRTIYFTVSFSTASTWAETIST